MTLDDKDNKPIDAAGLKKLVDQEKKAQEESKATTEAALKAKTKADEAQEAVMFARKNLQYATADKAKADKRVAEL